MEKLKTLKGCNSIFAKRLILLMERNSTKQIDLANYLGLTKQTIIKYKKGEIVPSIEVLQKICKYFNVSSDYLLGFSSFANNVEEERYFGEIEKIIHKTKKYEEERKKCENHLINCFKKMLSNIRVFPKEIFSNKFNEEIDNLGSMLTSYNDRDDEKFDYLKDTFYEFAEKYDAYYKATIKNYFEIKKE